MLERQRENSVGPEDQSLKSIFVFSITLRLQPESRCLSSQVLQRVLGVKPANAGPDTVICCIKKNFFD